MAAFRLVPGAASRAVAHRRCRGDLVCRARRRADAAQIGGAEEIAVSRAILAGMHFRLCNDGAGPLDIIAVTMPPWPGDDEACAAEKKWPTTVAAPPQV
jgi:hypothetical protein